MQIKTDQMSGFQISAFESFISRCLALRFRGSSFMKHGWRIQFSNRVAWIYRDNLSDKVFLIITRAPL